MEEALLHYLWQYQKFISPDLQLTDGGRLSVFYPGNHNHDAGPDFSDARIKIADIQWVGKVEIHIKSSDWLKHGHQDDPNYKGVILHVVWQDDKEILIDGNPIPTLELQHHVDPEVLNAYQLKFPKETKVPCLSQLSTVDPIFIKSMLTRTATERLQRKAQLILDDLRNQNHDWDEVAYRTLAANFGFSVNKEAFLQLSRLLPYHILKKELSNPLSTRALLCGQAGFLLLSNTNYSQSLVDEYAYQRKKYNLPDPLPSTQWKFSKLRPANSPLVRIEQLATLLIRQPRLFSGLVKITDLKSCLETIRAKSMGDSTKHPQVGRAAAEIIIINTIAPLLAAYASYIDDDSYLEQALNLLEDIQPENNRITRNWHPDFSAQNAFESQAQIELITNYCFKRRCLRCSIGVKILNG